MGNVWIPEWLYKRLPLICLFWASVVWIVPFVWYAALSSAILYVYGTWLIYKRYVE